MTPSPVFFTLTASLQRPTVTKDAAGGALRSTWSAVTGATDLAVAVQPASAQDTALFAGRQITITHAVYMRTNPGFTRGDRLYVSDGRTFTVAGSIDTASAGRVFKLFCRELLD